MNKCDYCNRTFEKKISMTSHRRWHDKEYRKNMTKQSKLTMDKVREIRELYSNSSITMQRIADDFNVSLNTIWNIIKEKTWKDELNCPQCRNKLEKVGLLVEGQEITFNWICNLCLDMAKAKLQKHKEKISEEAITEFNQRMKI